jgi:hypothetical protein
VVFYKTRFVPSLDKVNLKVHTLCSSSPWLVPLFVRGRHAIIQEIEKQLTWSFIFTFRYIDDVLSLNNSKWHWVPVKNEIWFQCPIFIYMSNIPAAPAYGIAAICDTDIPLTKWWWRP